MKKSILAMGAVVLALSIASCTDSATTTQNVGDTKKGDKEVLYSGLLPAADADGIVYALKMEYDDDNNFMDGDYRLMETTLVTDSLGMQAGATSYTSGDFKVETKTVDGKEIKYIKLLPDAKDALGAPSACSNYFIVEEDNSLTMVSADLTRVANDSLNYTLSVRN